MCPLVAAELPLPARPELVSLDLGHLTAFDSRAVDEGKLKQRKAKVDAYLKQMAIEGVQALVDGLAELPREQSELGPLVALPEPTTRLPRQLPCPKPKPPTKWELYAQQKGIMNKKKERMVWDEAKGDWAPRWGFKRANDDSEAPIMEVREGEDPFADPWQRKALEKKERVLKNQMNRLSNLGRATAAAHTGALAGIAAPEVEATLTARGKTSRQKAAKEPREVKELKLRKAQVSTRSLGKFDTRLKDEPAPAQNAKRRKVLREGADERARNLRVLGFVTGGASDAVAMDPVQRGGAAGGAGGKGKGGGKKGKGGKTRGQSSRPAFAGKGKAGRPAGRIGKKGKKAVK